MRVVEKSIVAGLYWRFIDRFSKIFPRPLDSETLREYLDRVSKNIIESIKNDFRSLTILVERDLYSRHRVDRSEAEKYLRRIRDELE